MITAGAGPQATFAPDGQPFLAGDFLLAFLPVFAAHKLGFLW
jgi:hypothetical protein